MYSREKESKNSLHTLSHGLLPRQLNTLFLAPKRSEGLGKNHLVCVYPIGQVVYTVEIITINLILQSIGW